MKIAGSGSIAGGNYDESVIISGSGKITGSIKCIDIKASGAVKCEGDASCDGVFSASGSAKVLGKLNAKGVKTAGSVTVDGDIISGSEVDSSGTLKVKGNIKGKRITVSGDLEVGGEIEADEAEIFGTVECEGLINAEKVVLRLERQGNTVGSIGGSEITVTPNKIAVFVNKAPILAKLIGNVGKLEVKEGIEGDEITLMHVNAPSVTGRVVKIGEGCVIGHVRYSESMDISPDAKVGSSEKL